MYTGTQALSKSRVIGPFSQKYIFETRCVACSGKEKKKKNLWGYYNYLTDFSQFRIRRITHQALCGAVCVLCVSGDFFKKILSGLNRF